MACSTQSRLVGAASQRMLDTDDVMVMLQPGADDSADRRKPGHN